MQAHDEHSQVKTIIIYGGLNTIAIISRLPAPTTLRGEGPPQSVVPPRGPPELHCTVENPPLPQVLAASAQTQERGGLCG